MTMRPALLVLLAFPILGSAQHDITRVDPAPPGSAIAIPIPEEHEKRMKKYEMPELAGAMQALGSQLIDGRLPRPLVDFLIEDSKLTQRVSLFEGGLVVVNMTGAATLRKKVVIPPDALKNYLEAMNPDLLRGLNDQLLVPPEPGHRAQLRIYEGDGTFVERLFHPGRVLPRNLNDQVTPLRDLLRAISEDRGVTSSVAGYDPKPGDELVADDHKVYRVMRVIEGSNVVELKCLDMPATIFVAKKDLNLYFIGAKERD